MTYLEEFTEMVMKIQKENPDPEELKTWFLGAIAANTSAILDALEDMTNGNKL